MTAGPSIRRDVYISIGVVLLALAVRLPRLTQSLWYDEMTTVTEFQLRPWRVTVAAGAGQYVPNNHVLHTILVKLFYPLLTGGNDPFPPAEWAVRMPALVTGLALPVALAWPLRRTEPAVALGLAVLTAVNPWLVALGTEARGYTLLLLLGVVATNLLAAGRMAGYAATIALAIYAVPLAALLVPAHAIMLAVGGFLNWRRWLTWAAIGLAIAAVLYLPMASGLIAYYRHPYPATLSMRALLDWLPRYALCGDRVPRDGSGGPSVWLAAAGLIGVGTYLGARNARLRAMTVTLASVTAMSLILAAVDPAAREVRFIPWAAPLLCVGSAALATAVAKSRRVAGGIICVLAAGSVSQAWRMPPNQPIREGLASADQKVPAETRIVVAYLGARESIGLYGAYAPEHLKRGNLVPAPDAESLRNQIARAVAETGRKPWVVIYFEQQAAARDADPGDAKGLWTLLTANYGLDQRAAARLGDVALYAPK